MKLTRLVSPNWPDRLYGVLSDGGTKLAYTVELPPGFPPGHYTLRHLFNLNHECFLWHICDVPGTEPIPLRPGTAAKSGITLGSERTEAGVDDTLGTWVAFMARYPGPAPMSIDVQ